MLRVRVGDTCNMPITCTQLSLPTLLINSQLALPICFGFWLISNFTRSCFSSYWLCILMKTKHFHPINHFIQLLSWLFFFCLFVCLFVCFCFSFISLFFGFVTASLAHHPTILSLYIFSLQLKLLRLHACNDI